MITVYECDDDQHVGNTTHGDMDVPCPDCLEQASEEAAEARFERERDDRRFSTSTKECS